MKHFLSSLIVLSAIAVIALSSCNKRRVYYECACYVNGQYTRSYELGRVPGDKVESLCHEVQQQNHQDMCQGAGYLK